VSSSLLYRTHLMNNCDINFYDVLPLLSAILQSILRITKHFYTFHKSPRVYGIVSHLDFTWLIWLNGLFGPFKCCTTTASFNMLDNLRGIPSVLKNEINRFRLFQLQFSHFYLSTFKDNLLRHPITIIIFLFKTVQYPPTNNTSNKSCYNNFPF